MIIFTLVGIILKRTIDVKRLGDNSDDDEEENRVECNMKPLGHHIDHDVCVVLIVTLIIILMLIEMVMGSCDKDDGEYESMRKAEMKMLMNMAKVILILVLMMRVINQANTMKIILMVVAMEKEKRKAGRGG